MQSGTIGKTGGVTGGPWRAAARFFRRTAAPVVMAATLLTLGALAWPSADNQTSSGSGATGDNSGGSAAAIVAPQAGKGANAAANQAGDDPASGTQTGDGEPTEKPPLVTNPPATATTVAPACFEPLFRDDFDGSVLDPAWTVYTTNGNHSVHAVRRAEAVSVEDGKLVITASNDENGVAASGGIRLGYSQAYGRYTFRVRTDTDPANATSGVVLTWPVSESQPLDGENNIYETTPQQGNRQPFYSFVHQPFDTDDSVSQTEFVHLGDASQWQEMSMDWTPEYLEISWVDPTTGKARGKRLTETSRDLITDAEHFLAIQLDLFKGALIEGDEVRMEVDWVEVYAYCGG